jgi:hypothetical protein
MSTYQDGIYLYDLTNPSNTTVYGFFDTHPQHGVNDNFSTNAYRGNWGAYPYLPSKIIIACDMQNGIFILDGDNTYKNSVVGMTEIDGIKSSMSIYPNPSKDYVELYIANQFNEDITYYLSDIYGNILEQNKIYCTELLFKQPINTSYLKNGCYFITVKGNQIQETKKIIIQN